MESYRSIINSSFVYGTTWAGFNFIARYLLQSKEVLFMKDGCVGGIISRNRRILLMDTIYHTTNNDCF